MARKFIVDGTEYPDPGADVTPEQFKQMMVSFLPELANADMTSEKQGEDTIYHFKKRVGVKGCHMTEAENIDRVITALLKVPEKKLLIIEIANAIPIINGELDYQELTDRQLAVNLAIAEAKVYGAHTLQAVDSLVRLRAIREA